MRKLALVDIDSEVLEDVYKLVTKMIQGKQADIELEMSTEKYDACRRHKPLHLHLRVPSGRQGRLVAGA